jgi:HSP20 family molecular chaperone IbpA
MVSHESEHSSQSRKTKAPGAQKLAKVVEIKRQMKTRRPVVAALEPEIAAAWLNRGVLTLALSKAYQTRREVVEVIVRDGVRAQLAQLKKAA